MKKKTMRKGVRPDFRLALIGPANGDAFHQVFPFQRNWIAIAAVAAFDAVFLIPAITTFQQAAAEWSRLESLFDLTGALFLTGWLMGWSIAPLTLTTVLALMLFGREVLRASPGRVEVIIGLPFIGVGATYQTRFMRNLRFQEKPPKPSGTAWRGDHVLFDYGANTVAFGSNLQGSEMASLRSSLHMATGQAIRRGEANAEELNGDWPASPLSSQFGEEAAAPPALEAAQGTPVGLASPSTLLLIVANLIPVFGAAVLGWRLSDVMVLYWAESAVIGFFNVLKMIIVARWFALFGVPFFIGHFGAFMAVHFMFLYGLFVKGPNDMSSSGLGEVLQLFLGLWPGLAALFISHGFSFLRNFVGRREYQGRNMNTQMTEPYSRIVFMHLVLIFGGGLTMFLGEPTPVLLIVIGLKIWFDIQAHLKQRGSARGQTGSG